MSAEGGVATSQGGGLRLVSLAARPDLLEEFIALDDLWQGFMLEDPYALLLGRVGLHVASYAHLLMEGDEVLGRTVTVPVTWSVEDDLPARGWDAAIESAVEVLLSIAPARCTCALEVTLHRHTKGRGLGGEVLKLLREDAAARSLEGVIVPVRPTGKSSDPRQPMEDYLAGLRAEGRTDPWLGVHESLGGEVAGVAELSMTISATFESWKSWTGIDPDEVDGAEMTVDGGLAPVLLDRGNRTGTYVEANVWCKHRLSPPAVSVPEPVGAEIDLRDQTGAGTGAGTGDSTATAEIDLRDHTGGAPTEAEADLRDFDSVPVPPEPSDGWRVTLAEGDLVAEAEKLEYETFHAAGFCGESALERVEAYDPWRGISHFVVVVDPDGVLQGTVRFMLGDYDQLPVGAFERTGTYPPDPVLEYASLSVRPGCRKTGVTEWLYRAVWQQATLRGAASMVAIGETWLMDLLNEAYEFGFEQLGPTRWYMGGDCFAMGTAMADLMQRMLRQPSLFDWGSSVIPLEDIPLPEIRSAVAELRRSLTRG